MAENPSLEPSGDQASWCQWLPAQTCLSGLPESARHHLFSAPGIGLKYPDFEYFKAAAKALLNVQYFGRP